jgi:hypothetical protein
LLYSFWSSVRRCPFEKTGMLLYCISSDFKRVYTKRQYIKEEGVSYSEHLERAERVNLITDEDVDRGALAL